MLGVSPKYLNIVLKYLGGLHSHLRGQIILFKPKTIDGAYVKEQYLEMDKKEGQPSGFRHIDRVLPRGNRKWK
jgi:hypothetical protein